MRAAAADARLLPIQSESSEPLEVIPVDYGELRLAPKGSRPGLTGKTELTHEEAMLASAARGSLAISGTYADIHTPTPGSDTGIFIEFEPGRRAFVQDLLASFYFAGIRSNALNILVIALACSLTVALQYVLVLFGPFLLLMVPVYGVVFLYTVQFYWSTLRVTAGGDDDIPWAQTDWSFWYDGLKPVIWMLMISALCMLPRLLLGWFAPPAVADNPAVGWLVLAVGWFFWPVAVMSVALGNTILFVRPDWLVRCVVGIGPVYVVAWLAVMLSLAGWFAFLHFCDYWIWIPVVGFAVNLYFGYVVFRTLGLLFRHFRARFPWKF